MSLHFRFSSPPPLQNPNPIRRKTLWVDDSDVIPFKDAQKVPPKHLHAPYSITTLQEPGENLWMITQSNESCFHGVIYAPDGGACNAISSVYMWHNIEVIRCTAAEEEKADESPSKVLVLAISFVFLFKV